MDRGEDIVAHHALRNHYGVLVVVTLPRNVGNEQVAAQGQLTILSCVTLGEDVALLHTLTLVADRTKVDGHVLVGAAELGDAVFLQSRLEADELVVLGAVVKDADGRSVDIFDDTVALGGDHRTAVLADLTLKSGTHDGRVVVEQRHSLAHHVTSHQGAVTVVVLQERNEAGRYRGNLLRADIHEVHLIGRNNRIISILTALDHLADEVSVGRKGRVALTDNLLFLFLGGEIDDVVVVHIDNRIVHLAVRSDDEAQVVDLGIDAERGDQTDIGTFRTLDRTQTTIVSIVNVTHLETCTLTRQTARTQCRETTLVGHLGQRVGLVHELRQRVSSEEGIDDA